MAENWLTALTAECPECSTEVSFEVMPRVGQLVTCTNCTARLEVAFLHPLMLDWVDGDPDAAADLDLYEDWQTDADD
jgi:lysine biosynthesis protein LysW